MLLYKGAQGRGLSSLHKKQLAPVSSFYFGLHSCSIYKAYQNPQTFPLKLVSLLHIDHQEIHYKIDFKAAMTQKIVIKVQMANEKCRSKVMALVAATGGVDSVALAGDGKDQVVVVGNVDSVKLTSDLRKKVGFAQLVEVGEAKKEEKKPEVAVIETPPPWYYPAPVSILYEHPAAWYGYGYP